MSTLNSSSTNAQVWQAFDDNASFEEDGDAGKAAAFVTACRILLRRQPKRFSVDGQAGEFNADFIAAEMERARRFIASTQSASRAGRARYFDLGDCRE